MLIGKEVESGNLTRTCRRRLVGVLDGEELVLRAFSMSWSSWSSFIISSTMESSRVLLRSSFISWGTEHVVTEAEGNFPERIKSFLFFNVTKRTLNDRQSSKGEGKFWSISSMGSSLGGSWLAAKKAFYMNIKYMSSGAKHNGKEVEHQWGLIHIYELSINYSWGKLYIILVTVQISYNVLIIKLFVVRHLKMHIREYFWKDISDCS